MASWDRDTQRVQAAQAAPVRPQRPLKRWEVVALIVWTLLIVACGWEIVVGPVPDTQAGEMRVMRTQMAALPAYPGTNLVDYHATDEVLRPPDVLESYTFTGRCEDVQQHYLAAATQAGWAVLHPLYVMSRGGPGADEFHTDYQQRVAGYRLFLSVGCFVHPDSADPPEAGHIYSVYIADVAPVLPN